MKTMHLTSSCFVLLLLTCKVLSTELPSFIHVCHLSDPDLEKCVIQSVEQVKPILVTGAPEYNIPSVEPMVIEDFVEERSTGLTLQIKDVVTYGGSEFTVQKITLHRKPMSFTAELLFPHMTINASYHVQGKILILPIKHDGDFYGNLTNIKSTNTMVGELYEKDGEEYVRLVSNDVKLEVEGGRVHFENTHTEKIINDMINEVINRNLHEFFKELTPVIEKNLEKLMLDISNKIVEPYPYDLLFPE